MSNVQWTGEALAITPARPVPTAVDQLGAEVEKLVATLGGPKVKRTLGAVEDGNVSSTYVIWTLLSIVGTALAAYHGYKRNHESVGSAVGWGVLGGLFPVITVPVALAQGYGKPAGARDNPGEFTEVGVFEHEGKKYEAGGAFYDAASGTLAGYPAEVAPHKSSLPGQTARYVLRRFNGVPIAPLRLVKKYRGGGGRGQMYAWSAVYDGKVFSGRNSGPNMILRMRAGRSSK